MTIADLDVCGIEAQDRTGWGDRIDRLVDTAGDANQTAGSDAGCRTRGGWYAGADRGKPGGDENFDPALSPYREHALRPAEQFSVTGSSTLLSTGHQAFQPSIAATCRRATLK